MDRLKKEFTTLTLVMTPGAIAINVAAGQLIFTLKVPLYIDSIGAVLVGALANLTGAAKPRKYGTGLNMPTLNEIKSMMDRFGVDLGRFYSKQRQGNVLVFMV